MRRFRIPWIKLIILLLVGAGLELAILKINGAAFDRANLASDTLFAQASVMLAWALIRKLGNLKMFTSFTYSFRQFHNVFQGKPLTSAKMKDDYLVYRKNRPVHRDIPVYLIAGCILLALSLTASFI